MAINAKPGQSLKVTVTKAVTRSGAVKTLQRLFMLDPHIAGPIEARSANFIPLPKRRGGCIWTKRCNKVHATIEKGVYATLKVSPQILRDLASVEAFVQVGVI